MQISTWLDRVIIACLFLIVVFAPHSIAITQTAWLLGLAVWVARFAFYPRPKLFRSPVDYALIGFFILSGVSEMIDEVFRVTWGHVLDPAWTVNRVWCTLLGVDPPDGPGFGASIAALATFILLLVVVIERKLRPVEVVR